MNKTSFYYGPPRDLTPEELEALCDVRAGIWVSEGMRYRLELRDLVEKGLPGWQLTKTGEMRLAAGK
jgi:hypothetical protein